jgi:hypothetical protein
MSFNLNFLMLWQHTLVLVCRIQRVHAMCLDNYSRYVVAFSGLRCQQPTDTATHWMYWFVPLEGYCSQAFVEHAKMLTFLFEIGWSIFSLRYRKERSSRPCPTIFCSVINFQFLSFWSGTFDVGEIIFRLPWSTLIVDLYSE